MKPTITGHKRPLEQDTYTEISPRKRPCPSREAREVAAILVSLDDPCSRDLSPATQEALRVINKSLQRGYPLLDLHDVPAADLADLPIGLIHPAVHTIQTLRLPPGLKCLPSFCQQLSKLQRLDLPDFAGSELDLTGMVALHQLSGSATQEFKQIIINTLADIRFQAPEEKSKIYVYRYDGERLVQEHALPCHPYFKVLPGYTAPDFIKLNGASVFAGTQNEILCDTIAPAILYRRLSSSVSDWKKIGYFGITNAGSLSATITEQHCQFYATALINSDSYALVSDGKFSEWLYTQFELMLTEGQRPPSGTLAHPLVRGMRVFSTNHELHFLMMIKPGPTPVFIAEMYDPNLTRTHRRMVANRLEQIVDPGKPWRLMDFISKERMKAYMRGNESAVLCFAGMGQRDSQQASISEFWLAEADWSQPDVLFTLIDMRLAACIKPYWDELLSQYTQKKISLSTLFNVLDAHAHNKLAATETNATHCMIEFNHALVATEFIPCIAAFAEAYFLASPAEKYGLPDDPLPKLLAPMNSWSHFITKLSNENKTSLHTYFSLATSLLDKGHMPESDVLALLSAKNSAGHGAIVAALKANDLESLRLLGKLLRTLIARGALNANDALGLIGDTPPATAKGDPQAFIWQACALGSTELIHEIASLLITICKKDQGADDLSYSSAVTTSPSASTFFLSDYSDTDSSEYGPSNTTVLSAHDQLPQAQIVDESLRNSLHKLIFGNADPESLPSLLSGETQGVRLMGNIRQLVQLLIDHEVLSILDHAGRFMIATDDLFAEAGDAEVSHSAEMMDIVQEDSQRDSASGTDTEFRG